MTCASVLDRLLDSDLVELGGEGESSLAVHLRQCAGCRAAADRILSDTSMLAMDVTRRPLGVSGREDVAAPVLVRSRRAHYTHAESTRARITIGLAAATLIIVGLRGWSSRRVTSDEPLRPHAAAPLPLDAERDSMQPTRGARASIARHADHRVARGIDRSPRRSPRVLPASVEAVAATPVVVAAVAPTAAIAPVRIEPRPLEPLGNRVAADPPAGTRAVVRRTANPAVTVVWLYR